VKELSNYVEKIHALVIDLDDRGSHAAIAVEELLKLLLGDLKVKVLNI
jgi:hypothetical protein